MPVLDLSVHAANLVRRMPWSGGDDRSLEKNLPLITREWLVTNGLGGYASGTISGVMTRRYHGLLVAALPAPHGRTMMLNHLSEQLRLPDGQTIWLGGDERVGGALELHGAQYLREFRLQAGLPYWTYAIDGFVFERSLVLPYRQNTVHVTYRLLEGSGTLRLKVRPAVHFRYHDSPVNEALRQPYSVHAVNERYELKGPPELPSLRMRMRGTHPAFTVEGRELQHVLYRVEESRGYQFTGNLWSPGYFRVDLSTADPATLVASTESWDTVDALSPESARDAEGDRRTRLLCAADGAAHDGLAAELALAADQFIITPAGRVEEAARAHALGDEVRTVIAGYHWFTDWGRDTMISLEGLTLVTGREVEAGYILRTFAHYVRDGLIPNMFPEGEKEGLYHTADATLWFFHAMDRYLARTGDRLTLGHLLPTMLDIIRHHAAGTRFGIGLDERDGLLRQGADGYQLTWMDAKVDDWVVTPRRGKAVEINALWYNALKLAAGWMREEPTGGAYDVTVEQVERWAEQVRASFNARFWYDPGGYLYDLVDGEHGDDPACRPNQLLAFSLAHPVLDESRWASVLRVVTDRLLTPVGLRSLAPDHPDYKERYDGDLRARDAAYHQGTVWAWLIGPYVDAWLRVHPGQTAAARALLTGFDAHLSEACLGSISEIFDAGEPFTPRGCIAQAWSVAEVLRCLVATAPRRSAVSSQG
jgi:predicted glycogen debranching enzyme